MTLSTIMYHWVRPIRNSRWPRIRGLELDDFKSQLSYLKRNYTIVSLPDVINALNGVELNSGELHRELPPNACLLTFDDGYLDHYQHVFPLLHDAKVSGAFFPIGRSVAERWIADVNKIHWIIAHAPRGMVTDHIYAAIGDIPAVTSRWDDTETASIKRALQYAPPEVIDELFWMVEHGMSVTADDLYMTPEQIKLMATNGMHFGVHGWNHVRFSRMTEAEQAADLDASIAFLRGLGVLPERWAMAYPYGADSDWTQRMADLADERGCVAAFTTRSAVANLEFESENFAIPRLDTTDVPRA